MKIALINTPYGIIGYNPIKVPPFGLSFIAKSLKQKKISYKLFDLGYSSINYSKDIIKKIKSPFFGISFFQENCHLAFELIKYIKLVHPNSKIIVGGIFPTMAHKEILTEFCEVDFVVRGDGEEAVLDILNGSYLKEDLGISFRKNNSIYLSKKISRIKNLDLFSPPLYSNEIISNYHLSLKESNLDINTIPIIWSRGCSHNCAFCTISPDNLWRCRSNKSVLKEISENYSFSKENHIIFFDANPLQYPKLFINLIKSIRNKFDLTFSCSARADTLTNNSYLTKKLAKLGCKYLELGVESFNSNALNYYSKGLSKRAIYNSLKLLNENNISIELDFILFNPYTTKKDILLNLRELKRWGFKSNLSIDALFSYSKLYFGTSLRRDYESREKRLFDYKYLPDISELFVHKDVRTIYLSILQLKPFIKDLYSNGVFVEELIKTKKMNNFFLKQLITLNLELRACFFEGYVNIVTNGPKEVKFTKNRLNLILKKINHLRSVKAINSS